MSRELLENAAINVAHCGRELDKAKAALETAQLNLDRAKDELIERAIAFRVVQPLGMPMPAPPPMAPAMPRAGEAAPWGGPR